MWILKNLKTNETMQFETMEAVAQWFNFFEDIYEDGVWDKFIELHPSYEIKRVDDEMETIDDEKVYEFLNKLHLKYEGKLIYFGTTKEFCRDYNISEYDYYEYDYYSEDIIKLPKREFESKDLKIMYVVKKLKTNETMQFGTIQEVAQWLNFFEDLYEDGVWDKFIEMHSKTYEIKRVAYYVAGDRKVDKNFHLKNKEDDDLPF